MKFFWSQQTLHKLLKFVRMKMLFWQDMVNAVKDSIDIGFYLFVK